MILDELTTARIARYGAEINLARVQIDNARAALERAQQAEVEAVGEYVALHRAHDLDPERVTVLVKDVAGPQGKVPAGTVITKPDAQGQGGGQIWDPPPPPETVPPKDA